MVEHKSGIAVVIMFIIIFANISTISNVIQQMNLTSAKRNNSWETNFAAGDPSPLEPHPMQALAKIFPRVEKVISRTSTETEINITVTNTMNLPIHNFSLTYWRIKDSVEEQYMYSAVHTDTDVQFIIQISEDDSRIIFNYTMTLLSSFDLNGSVIFSSKFHAIPSTSDLTGDGAYWRCDESFSASDIYTIDDPAKILLNSTQECAKADFDADGIPNSEEFRLGLDPFTPNLWLEWISLDREFRLKTEEIPDPIYLFGAQIHIGILLESICENCF